MSPAVDLKIVDWNLDTKFPSILKSNIKTINVFTFDYYEL